MLKLTVTSTLEWQGIFTFNENFVSLLNTLETENWHKDLNSEGNKTVNAEVSEDCHSIRW